MEKAKNKVLYNLAFMMVILAVVVSLRSQYHIKIILFRFYIFLNSSCLVDHRRGCCCHIPHIVI
jgi:hypothetical protein